MVLQACDNPLFKCILSSYPNMHSNKIQTKKPVSTEFIDFSLFCKEDFRLFGAFYPTLGGFYLHGRRYSTFSQVCAHSRGTINERQSS